MCYGANIVSPYPGSFVFAPFSPVCLFPAFAQGFPAPVLPCVSFVVLWVICPGAVLTYFPLRTKQRIPVSMHPSGLCGYRPQRRFTVFSHNMLCRKALHKQSLKIYRMKNFFLNMRLLYHININFAIIFFNIFGNS